MRRELVNGQHHRLAVASGGIRRLGLVLALNFEIVEKFLEHDPGEHREAVEVAVETLVFAHDVARGLQEGAEALGGGGLHESIKAKARLLSVWKWWWGSRLAGGFVAQNQSRSRIGWHFFICKAAFTHWMASFRSAFS
jgi:hypothetical protein